MTSLIWWLLAIGVWAFLAFFAWAIFHGAKKGAEEKNDEET